MKIPVMPVTQEPITDDGGLCRMPWYLFLDSLRRSSATHTAGTLTAGSLIVGNGGASGGDLATGDLTGDVTTAGTTAVTLANTPAARTHLGVDASLTVAGWTVALAKLTTTGTQGSLTVDTHGRITAYTSPT